MDKFLRPIGNIIRNASHSILRLSSANILNSTIYWNHFDGLLIQVRHESTKKPLENLSPFTLKFLTKENEETKQETHVQSPIIDEIKSVIEEKIRPTIQEDGGDIEFVSYENNIVKVRLQGACVSCPSSSVTLKSGVKNMLQYHFEEIEDVEQVLDEDDDDDDDV